LIHSDHKPANTLLHPDGQSIALVDWDLAMLGDPASDVARVIQQWELTAEQAAAFATRVREGVSRHDPSRVERFDERVATYARYWSILRMHMLTTRIADRVQHASPDPEKRELLLDELAADAEGRLRTIAPVLGTEAVNGRTFVDLVLEGASAAGWPPRASRQAPPSYRARIGSSG